MDINELRSRIKSNELSGFYILCGEEDYLKKYYLGEIRAAVITDEVFSTFNHVVYDGDDIDFSSVREDIKSPPMMADHKLIEWNFANLDGLKEGERSALESLALLKEDYPSAVFVITASADGFDAGQPKRPSKLAARLGHGFEIIDFPKSTDTQLLAWLKKHFDAEGVAVDARTLNALLFRSGRSMEILNNEVIKLASFAKANGKTSVTEEDVERIASPTTECDAFELSNAVIEKNIDRAFSALADLKARRIEPPAVVAMLERTYSDLTSTALLLLEGGGLSEVESVLKFHPFKAKLYVSAAKKIGVRRLSDSLAELRRLDASSKSGGLSGYGAIEMFITSNI